MENMPNLTFGAVRKIRFDVNLTLLMLGILGQICLYLFGGRSSRFDAIGAFLIRRRRGEVFGEENRICFEHLIQLVINSIYDQYHQFESKNLRLLNIKSKLSYLLLHSTAFIFISSFTTNASVYY